ncbi:hypothetical protein OS125_11450 [Corynebacterium sp. P7003]|uniref:Uncharacterized protein n=1 Tax=Corynebacterium pygosceleis TaxID=2800406 RepID=A0ABT3X0R4_9CORY|nr:hypothetical protein [Corynebacterium pygosceleis]MCX7445846.1 hypothetical protein [Corynebacterium pygosceleis]
MKKPEPLSKKITRLLAKHGIDDPKLAKSVTECALSHHRYRGLLDMNRWRDAENVTHALLTVAYGPLDPEIDPVYAAILRRDGLIDTDGHLTPVGAGVAAFIDASETAKAAS